MRLVVGWFCFTSHRQRGHLEMAPPFTALCEGREAWFLHCSHPNRTPGHRVAVHYTTAAQYKLPINMIKTLTVFRIICEIVGSKYRLGIRRLVLDLQVSGPMSPALQPGVAS